MIFNSLCIFLSFSIISVLAVDTVKWTAIKGTTNSFYIDKSQSTFREAEKRCRKIGGDLATIINSTYQDSIFKAAKEAGVSSYWIGLEDSYVRNAFEWVSRYKALSSVFWISTPSKNRPYLVNCVGVNVTTEKTQFESHKSWSVMHCEYPQPFVCMKDGLPDTSLPDSVPKKNGTCPSGFFRLDNRCIKIFAEPKDHLNWEDANKACQKLGVRGGLASVRNQEDQNILTALMLNQTSDLWIGLSKDTDGTSFQWVRNYSVGYTHWKPGEPNGLRSINNTANVTNPIEICVMMYRRNKSPGEWNDQSCKASMGYICESDLLDKTDDSKSLPDPLFPPHDEKSKCKENESYYNDYCYFKGDSAKSFEEAEKSCQKSNTLGHLVSPHNLYEIAYLNAYLAKNKLNTTLTGYRITYQRKGTVAFHIYSSDNIEAATQYFRGIDFTHVQNTSCLSTTEKDDNHVKTVNCTTDSSFTAVCRYPLEGTNRHPANLNFTCDKDWHKGTGSRRCLKLFSSDKVKMKDAEKKCVSEGGHLLSIHSVQEQTDASDLSMKTDKAVWIGLELTWNSDNLMQMHWTDNSPINFYHWRVGEPSPPTATKVEHCVEMRRGSNDWNNRDCSQLQDFICYREPKKVVPQTDTTTASPTTTPTTTDFENTTSFENTTDITSTTPTSTPTTTTATTTPVATTPKTPPTKKPTTPAPSCPKGMVAHFMNCYLVVREIETWQEAQKNCKKLGENVNLASIHGLSENEIIQKLIKKKEDGKTINEAWIGLSDLYNKFDEGFTYWTDDSPISYPHYGRNNISLVGEGGCILMSRDGFWYNKHCTYKRPYVCKLSNEKYPKPEHKAPPKGAKYCLKGFSKFKDSCYKLVRRPETFNDASAKCKTLTDDKFKSVTHLARVDTLEDNEFLLSLMDVLSGRLAVAWLGLHFEKNEFHWDNNDPVVFSRWPVNMTYQNEKTACVALGEQKFLIGVNGHWFARSCSDKLPYICQTPVLSPKRINPIKCPLKYDGEYRDSCYYLDKTLVSFDAAKQRCDDPKLQKRNMVTSMLTIRSVTELSYLRAWLITSGITDRPVWLALKLKPGDNIWRWADGHLINFTYTSGFPEHPEGCLTLILKSTDRNKFGMVFDPKCNQQGYTVCKQSPRLDVVAPRDCLHSTDDATYIGLHAKTISGRDCIRWDNVRDPRLLLKLETVMPDGSVSAAANLCRYLPGIVKGMNSPFCFTTRGNSTHVPHAEACDVKLCTVPAHGYVVVVAILVIVLLVTIGFFVGLMVWRRTNTAQGFIPYLRQHDPEGGTSFHNPIYTPAATC